MAKSLDRTGRGAVGALAALVLSAALTSAAPAPNPRESARIPFAERFHTTGHGGIARLTRTVATCRPAARGPAVTGGPSCSAPRHTGRARLRLPAGSRVRYARLYWGGDLRGGGPTAARDAGQVLLAGPRGRYEAVRAEGPLGRRSTGRTDDYQASADVTPLVRQGGAGPYAVARPAPGHRRARGAARAGWTLVVAYENPREPLRRLTLWDGFEPLGGRRRAFAVELAGLGLPARAHGRVGVVDYHGTRRPRRTISARAGGITPVALHNSVDQPNGTENSADPNSGRRASLAPVDHGNRAFDSEVLDLTPALRSGGDRLTFRFTTRKAGYLLGALFVQADLRR
ncbi:hypothetical protein [Streptomyces lunalinharesii]|uniref:DUF3344 domain-containing protein n=1 Tax=Streptomyces lunalinharesii TaxID=333384 RepID=A0ABN3S074_9ACTN